MLQLGVTCTLRGFLVEVYNNSSNSGSTQTLDFEKREKA